MNGCRRPQRGYTLLEVLVAFAILGMTLAVLFRIFAAGVGNVGAAAEYAQAVIVGEARLATPIDGTRIETGVSQGTDLGKFRWTRRISEQPLSESDVAAQPLVSAYRINVAVEWPAGRTTRAIELETLRVAGARDDAGLRR